MPDFRAPSDEPAVVTPDQPPVTKSIVPDPGARSLDTPAPTVKHVMGGPGSGFPVPDDYYPSRSIYAGETGTATVKVCVDRKGHLTSAPSIEQSTGYARLDAGAINLAKAGSGHYRPSTDDGRPVDSCYDFRVRFNLKN
jgi:TonB family protein